MKCEKEFVLEENLSKDELFLLYFLFYKYKLKKIIKELNTIADHADKTHKLLTGPAWSPAAQVLCLRS